MLCSFAHLSAHYDYPVQDLNDCWILISVNMNRNRLWGSAGGMIFVSKESWDVQDRLNWVDRTTNESLHNAAKAIFPSGNQIGLFNRLNWKLNDPVVLNLPVGKAIAGATSELLPDNTVLCRAEMPSMSVGGWRLDHRTATPLSLIDLPENIDIVPAVRWIDYGLSGGEQRKGIVHKRLPRMGCVS